MPGWPLRNEAGTVEAKGAVSVVSAVGAGKTRVGATGMKDSLLYYSLAQSELSPSRGIGCVNNRERLDGL